MRRLLPWLVCALFTLGTGCGDRGRRNFGVVEEGELYRSGRLETEVLRDVIQEYDIKTVVDLGSFDRFPRKERSNREATEELGAAWYGLQMVGDGRANPNGYVAALRLLSDPANQPALVQCAAGSQRTGTAVVLYRHLVQGRFIQAAYEESFEHGHEPDNYRWITFLADWVDEIGDAYRDGDWVEGLPPVEPVRGQNVRALPARSQWKPRAD